ncbi:hypothetical protein M8C21_024467, partial [Ambrosia artemisiifolia]
MVSSCIPWHHVSLFFVPYQEPPLVTTNTVLSNLAVDYPFDKVSCYVSDDGAVMLSFESLSETSEFARKWVLFYKKYNIEPRAPELSFDPLDFSTKKGESSTWMIGSCLGNLLTLGDR